MKRRGLVYLLMILPLLLTSCVHVVDHYSYGGDFDFTKEIPENLEFAEDAYVVRIRHREEYLSLDSGECRIVTNPQQDEPVQLAGTKADISVSEELGAIDIVLEKKTNLTISLNEQVAALVIQGFGELDSFKVESDYDFYLKAEGAINGQMDVTAQQLMVEADGACDLDIKGRVHSLGLASDGASRINSYDCQSEKVDVVSNGTGSLQLYASQSLNLEVAGAYAIDYKGDPKEVNTKLEGAVHINNLDR